MLKSLFLMGQEQQKLFALYGLDVGSDANPVDPTAEINPYRGGLYAGTPVEGNIQSPREIFEQRLLAANTYTTLRASLEEFCTNESSRTDQILQRLSAVYVKCLKGCIGLMADTQVSELSQFNEMRFLRIIQNYLLTNEQALLKTLSAEYPLKGNHLLKLAQVLTQERDYIIREKSVRRTVV